MITIIIDLGVAARWDTATGEPQLVWPRRTGHEDCIWQVAFSPDGLAPSAAAAAVLAEQTGIRTDTLAKLTWSLDHGELPDWAAAVGPGVSAFLCKRMTWV